MLELQKIFGAVIWFGLFGSPTVHAAASPAPAPPFQNATQANSGVAAALEGAITKFLNINELQSLGYSMYAEGVSNPVQTQVQNHITSYCSAQIPTEAQAFGCKVSGQNGEVLPQELGDVKASVLLDSTTLTPDAATTAQVYIKTLLMANASSKYKDMISNTETFGKNGNLQAQYAKFLGNVALLGLSVYSMENMYSMRSTGAALGATGGSSESMLSVMEKEASQRYMDPNYVKNFIMDPNIDQTALLRDMAMMQSFSIWMQYQSYRQNERIEALLAAMASKAAAFGMQ